jgi:hypothetical protein
MNVLSGEAATKVARIVLDFHAGRCGRIPAVPAASRAVHVEPEVAA